MDKLFMCFMLILFSCNEQNQDKKQQITQLEIITKEDRYSLSVQASSPCEVFFEDILLDYHDGSGAVDYDIDLNQWILSSGLKKIKARVLPKVKPTKQLYVDSAAVSYFKITVLKNDEIYQELKFDAVEPNSPAAETLWELSIDLPYTIRGWSDALDLQETDSKALKNEMLEKYNQLLAILNAGNVADYNSFFQQADEEFFIANYYNDAEKIAEKKSISETILSAKNSTKLQNEYTLVFYAGGRIVTLENKNRKSPLVADLGEELQYFSIFLMREAEGKPLTVIR